MPHAELAKARRRKKRRESTDYTEIRIKNPDPSALIREIRGLFFANKTVSVTFSLIQSKALADSLCRSTARGCCHWFPRGFPRCRGLLSTR